MPTSASATVPLVVQLLSPLGDAEEAALLEACSRAHQRGSCITEDKARAQDTLRATVELTDETHVLVELSDTHPWRSLFASRELRFQEEDSVHERARAIGLTIGVLSTTLTRGSQSEESEPSAEPRPPDAPPPKTDKSGESDADSHTEHTPRDRSETYPIEVSATVGLTGSPRWPALGPSGGVGGRLLPLTHLGVAADFQIEALMPSKPDPLLTVFSAAGGPSLRLSIGGWAAWLDLQAGASWIQARLADSNAPEPAGTRVSPLLRARTTVGAELKDRLWLTVAPLISLHLSPTRVFVDGQQVGNAGGALASLQLGLTWAPR